MARRSSGSSNDPSTGILAAVLMAVIFMPIAGLYLIINGENENQQTIGWVLIVISIIIWIATKG